MCDGTTYDPPKVLEAPDQLVEVMADPAVDPPITTGEVVQGKYRIGALVGFGGMAVVMAAHHLELDQPVAVKLLLPEHAVRADAVRRFLAEARAAARLKSENVARVLDVGTTTTKHGVVIPFMVMELLEGQDLDNLLAARERLPFPEAVEYVLQACDAVAEAHSLGIIHRDLKPGNLFLTARRDGAPVVKLLDFGISKIAQRSSGKGQHAVTADREMMGSPGYMSPEQVRSAKDVDPRTDIWSLGVILYELLTGDQAFPAATIADIFVRILHSPPDPIAMRAPEVPPALVDVVMRCLQKKPEGRYPNVEALADALRPFRSTTPIFVALPPPRAVTMAMSDGAISVNTVNHPPQGRRIFLHASLAFGAVGLALIIFVIVMKVRGAEAARRESSLASDPPPAVAIAGGVVLVGAEPAAVNGNADANANANANANAKSGAWLFSRNVDLAVFLGSAAFSFAALGVGAWAGLLHGETPGWAWVPAVILCDVAHVWSTAFRTYLDPVERQSRPWVLALVPAIGLAASIALMSVGELAFWRALAYLAIFHFVRQQYGWVSLYRARAGEKGRLGRVIDTAAIYAATTWPLLYWHTHVPRRFSWFVAGDVASLPSFVGSVLMPVATGLYVAALVAYAIRAGMMWLRGKANPGKDVVVLTTVIAWYTGIVAFDSDYAFTVTNVFMHGIPYFALVYVHTRARSPATEPSRAAAPSPAPSLAQRLTRHVMIYLGVLWLIAFAEELVWDRAVWHDRGWLFGDAWDLPAIAKLVIVPLLALPQLTHYVLDGFIWRRRSNPSVAGLVSSPTPQTTRGPHVTLSTSSP